MISFVPLIQFKITNRFLLKCCKPLPQNIFLNINTDIAAVYAVWMTVLKNCWLWKQVKHTSLKVSLTQCISSLDFIRVSAAAFSGGPDEWDVWKIALWQISDTHKKPKQDRFFGLVDFSLPSDFFSAVLLEFRLPY